MNHPKVIVRWKGYALKFHQNHTGNVYSVVKDADATQFTTHAEAHTKARQAGLKEGSITVETLAPSPATPSPVTCHN